MSNPPQGTVADVSTLENGQVHLKDQWCETPQAIIAITDTAADLDFSDVVFPTGFLPSGAQVQAVYLLLKWRKGVESSGLANAINGASKAIRVKRSTGAWGTDDLAGITFADDQLSHAANVAEGGDAIIGDADLSDEVDDVSAATYNIRSEETNRSDALVVDGDGITLHDVYTGLRVYYTLG